MLDFSLHHGELLDWIALGIYGEGRPLLQISEDAIARGAYNTIEYNAIPYAGLKNYVPGSASYVPDDYFKRILTRIFIKVTARTFVSTGSSAARRDLFMARMASIRRCKAPSISA